MAYYRNLYFSETPNDFHSQVKINSTTGSEIITTANAKDFIRVDTTADDTIIGEMITEARIWTENYIAKDIVAKTRTYYTPFQKERFVLPFAPVASITSVTVDDTAADYEVKGLDNEIIELNELPAKEIKVSYTTSGLDDSLLKQALLRLVSTFYDNRAEFVVGQQVNEIPMGVKNILSGYKTMFI
tara:strand:- start:3 stop:560 length:558 start_codon:yes stop_codon:yes gene_type:complete